MITNARDAARAHNHNYLGTEHILLGALRTPGIAAEVLQSLGITAEHVDAKVVELVRRGEATGPPMPPNARAPFTPRGKKVLDLSHREALSLGDRYVDTEHMLLGFARENDGIAARILLESGADYQTIRNELLRRFPRSRVLGVVVPERAAETSFGASIRIGPTRQLRRVLMAAAARALDDERTEITAEDLLLALTHDDTIAPLLADLGVDKAAVRDAIKRRRTPEAPPDPSATG